MTDTPTTAFTPVPLPDYALLPLDEMHRRAAAFYDSIRRRHTVRDFAPTPVPRALIETCLKAAGTAPSGANHQPWHFSVIGNAAMKTRIRLAAEDEERAFYEAAPARNGSRRSNPSAPIRTSRFWRSRRG